MNVQPRSYSFALATVVLLLVVGWVGRHTWQELRQLHRSFISVQADGFHLSDYVEASVRDLNQTVLRFDAHRNPAERAAFQKASEELKEWIQVRHDTAATPQQSDLMAKIKSAFEVYVSQLSAFLDERAPAATAPSATPMLDSVNNTAAPVLELCGKLKAAERPAQTQFMKDSQRALAWVRQLLIVVLALLVVLVSTGVVAIYRGVIGPLRVELGESRARATRQEKLASLGTLAAGVAHEIRNPLTAINVRLHSLKKNLAANSSEQEDALVIGHEIGRLERIVQDFLQFARPGEPKLLAVSADSLLAKVQSLFTPQLEKVSIRLNMESVPDVWVLADPHQIEQVLINLIQNAAESIEKGGTITLRARTGTARLTGRNRPVVILEVNDTGTGIPPEVQKRMFDPFFTTKEEGTGLGLAIAARIVETHGGALEFRSQLNRGTTFTILLPRMRPEESHEPAT